MRNLALLLALCATLLWATACESGTSGPSGSSNSWQTSADAGSSDSGNAADASTPNQQADSSTTAQADEAQQCVLDYTVNGLYLCDGVEETEIVAVPEYCVYAAKSWSAKPEDTQILPNRVIAKTGKYVNDCIRKGAK